MNLPPGLIETTANQLGVDIDKKEIRALENVVKRNNEETRLKMKQEELKQKTKNSTQADKTNAQLTEDHEMKEDEEQSASDMAVEGDGSANSVTNRISNG